MSASDGASAGGPFEWPPPGLGHLRGAAWAAARRIFAASVACLAIVAALSVAGGEVLTIHNPRIALWLIAAAFGTGLFVVHAGLYAWRLISEGGSAVYRGHTWPVVFETMADERGDTGALIAGEREYAALPAPQRRMMRRARMLAFGAAAAAAVAPLPAFFVVTRLATAIALTTSMAFALTLAPSLALRLLVRALRAREVRAVGEERRRIERVLDRRGVAARIVSPWYDRYAAAGAGQHIGAGQRGGVLRAWIVGAALAVAFIGAALVVAPLIILSIGGPSALVRSGLPPQLRFSSSDADRVFALRPDSTIASSAAGEALYALWGMPRDERPAYFRTPTVVIPPLPAAADSLFARGSGVRRAVSPLTPVAHAVKGGLRADERAYLDSVAVHPIWPAFRLVARAPRADYADAMFVSPLPPNLWVNGVPTVSRLTRAREIEYAVIVQAGVAAAHGRITDAEHALRELLSFGLRLVDDGVGGTDMSIGQRIVTIARNALGELYAYAGVTEAERLRTLRDSAAQWQPRRALSRVATTGTVNLRSPLSIRRSLYRADIPRSFKWDIAALASFSACADLRDALFGQSDDLDMALASARLAIARTPLENDLFTAYASALDRTPSLLDDGRPGARSTRRFVAWGGGVAAFMLGAPRVSSCTRLLVQPNNR